MLWCVFCLSSPSIIHIIFILLESPAMRMMQIKKNEKHEKKKQELQALIDKARKEKNLNCQQSESESNIQTDKIQPLIRTDQLEAKSEDRFEFKSIDSIMANTMMVLFQFL